MASLKLLALHTLRLVRIFRKVNCVNLTLLYGEIKRL